MSTLSGLHLGVSTAFPTALYTFHLPINAFTKAVNEALRAFHLDRTYPFKCRDMTCAMTCFAGVLHVSEFSRFNNHGTFLGTGSCVANVRFVFGVVGDFPFAPSAVRGITASISVTVRTCHSKIPPSVRSSCYNI